MMWRGVVKSGSPICRWMIRRPDASSAFARASTSKAVSVPRRLRLSASCGIWRLREWLNLSRGTVRCHPRSRQALTENTHIFVPAQRVRSFDHIVDQIREAISSGGIAPGERPPSERDLGVAFGVSRTTLREALRALEAQGVIEIRTGSRGGAFVAEPSSELVAAALGALLRFRSATARELAEFRVPFEAENAAWAARRADPAALAELEHIVGDVAVRASDGSLPWPEVA